MGEMRNPYKILSRKPKGRTPLRGPRCRWEDNIRMYLRDIGWEGVDWMHLSQDGDQWQDLVNMVMNFQIPQKAGNFLIN
jgi:hypothetical protein